VNSHAPASVDLAIALSIAGSDSGGGAGIQADLKTFHSFGVFGTTVVTAVTAQNTMGVSAVHPVPTPVVLAQLKAIASDLSPAAFKTGMLATRELVELVARSIDEFSLPAYVLDPVMVATSGDRLLDEDAVAAVRDLLVPRARIVTPNLPEAEILTDRPVRDLASMRRAAQTLVERGAHAALMKGGHLAGDEMVDLYWDGARELVWRRPRIRTRNTHGTGCTLSAGIAAGLARGASLPQAVEAALDFVARAIASAPELGSGNGPLNHLVEPSLQLQDDG
jgi:hydroxymethylpyrimidine/phosphomethylpyrimidine kinase